jgi:hypothetical protein
MPVSVDELNKSTTPCFTALAIKLGVTPTKVIKERKLLAFSDPANHSEIDKGGALRFKTFKEQGKHRRAMKSIKEKTVITESADGEKIYKTSTVEYQLHDKPDSLAFFENLFGMKKPKEVKLSGKLDIDIAGSRDKLANRLNAIAKRRGKSGSDKQPE